MSVHAIAPTAAYTTGGSVSKSGPAAADDGLFDGLSFWDLLDVINPLQHLPLIGPLYRHLTGDELKSGPRLAGGFLFGGFLGLAGSAVEVALEKTTGRDIGGHILALFGDDEPVDGDGLIRSAAAGHPYGDDWGVLNPNGPTNLVPPAWRLPDAERTITVSAPAGRAVLGTMPTVEPLGAAALAPPTWAAPASPSPSVRPRVEIVRPTVQRSSPATPPAVGRDRVPSSSPDQPSRTTAQTALEVLELRAQAMRPAAQPMPSTAQPMPSTAQPMPSTATAPNRRVDRAEGLLSRQGTVSDAPIGTGSEARPSSSGAASPTASAVEPGSDAQSWAMQQMVRNLNAYRRAQEAGAVRPLVETDV